MRMEDFREAMDELETIYAAEMLTVWEQGFFEDMQEALAEVGYRFTDPQIDLVLKMREKYDLDIRHGEAIR